jgi:16S rRNA (guanine966-N2)-methyltransferase
MRIIAGRLGGRTFQSPAGHRTHPMSDKIRGALFNALGDIEELSILDAFAGSGAIGFEAVSRGASTVLAIDSDRQAQQTIRQNIVALDVSKSVKLVGANLGAWLSTANDSFDVVICDPPYDDVKPELLARLAERCVLGGIVIFSLPPEGNVLLSPDYEPLSHKDYGDASLSFFKKIV